MIRRRVVVSGVVQGVGFRYSTQAEARRLLVSGWVRNRTDGTVEAQLEGDDDAVGAMIEWLQHGPRGASVSSVDVDDVGLEGSTGFEIGR